MLKGMIAFALLYLYEWRYLKRQARKRRTYYLVFGCLTAAFLYFLLVYYTRESPGVGTLLLRLFGPLQNVLVPKTVVER
ncbi:hypothetical protein N6H14_13970 [Paenibacillus sp. CC-CFT747]|nr:hypothetical protein N6H14_13970 [Paenibacillus sp. CC-CFT747]